MPDPRLLIAAARSMARRRQRIASERQLAAVLAAQFWPALIRTPDRTYCAYCGRRIDPKPGRKFCSDLHRIRAWKAEHKEAA